MNRALVNLAGRLFKTTLKIKGKKMQLIYMNHIHPVTFVKIKYYV